ncbi:hypothetical protein [Nocardioides cavernaquae]|uniref:Uncharacterized protein n=1 Tax=Nocardioides cavernaquae TaxID=2321396 RepID=A0A3A5H8J5_9ACTN|nr:hypothetical protein [Nocardioides cavernaquae]RJS46341.1 hypothetical protein D4739_09030 [Nocardioides cavernaquae]
MSTPVTSSTSRRLLIVLAALGVLAAMVLAVVLGKSATPDKAGGARIEGGFRELRADEFADAIVQAREEAGSWKFLQVETIDGKSKAVWEGVTVWNGDDDLAMTYKPQGAEGEFRLASGAWYWNDPASRAKPWIKLVPDGSGPWIAALDRLADPARDAEIFASPKDFRVVGAENIGSSEAVHYRITVDLEQVLDAQGVPLPGEAGQQQVYDVWLDAEDRIVKIVEPSSLGATSLTRIRTFFGYGDDYEIPVPPADQVKPGKFGPSPSAKAEPSASPAN